VSESISIPKIEDQHAFNLARWEELCRDPIISSLHYRIETDQHGHILMDSPAGFDHGDHQFDVGHRLRTALSRGKVVTECPISTSAGVRAADVAWISDERLQHSLRRGVLLTAPEICVEILSPSNTREEIDQKKQLYFESGAEEVWICDLRGVLIFFLKDAPDVLAASRICPNFPQRTVEN
jgi:Uma2 family endonuclease